MQPVDGRFENRLVRHPEQDGAVNQIGRSTRERESFAVRTPSNPRPGETVYETESRRQWRAPRNPLFLRRYDEPRWPRPPGLLLTTRRRFRSSDFLAPQTCRFTNHSLFLARRLLPTLWSHPRALLCQNSFGLGCSPLAVESSITTRSSRVRRVESMSQKVPEKRQRHLSPKHHELDHSRATSSAQAGEVDPGTS